MDSFVLENPLCVEYTDSMEEFPDFWGAHTFDPVMDSSLHEDDSLQSSWPTGLGINLVSMDHDGDLTGSDTALVILHDRLITDASDDAAPKSDLFDGVEIRSVQCRSAAPAPATQTPEKPKEAKDKPILVTTTIAKDAAVPAVSKLSHFINGSLTFPPTPPSSVSSDNEGCSSPARETPPTSSTNKPRLTNTSPSDDEGRANRLFLGLKAKPEHATSRHPINSPLISYQPKGSTGTIQLTEEEKRTLLAEGFPIPTRLPLSKAEERSLKKIRRKIKNKISAQESRRKKKEYMDTLEQRAQVLADENVNMRERLHKLENDNANLRAQLARLQKLITGDDVLVKTELTNEQ